MLDGRWLYVLALPIALGIVARRAGTARALVALIALAHVAILANVALFPVPIDRALQVAGQTAGASLAGGGRLNLVPFATIGPVIAGRAPPIATQIAILNVFVLTPAGIYLPLLFRSLRGWRALVAMTILGGASIEAAQLVMSAAVGFRYRFIDIDDVILNAIGIAVGWLIVRAALQARRPPHPAPRANDQGGATNR